MTDYTTPIITTKLNLILKVCQLLRKKIQKNILDSGQKFGHCYPHQYSDHHYESSALLYNCRKIKTHTYKILLLFLLLAPPTYATVSSNHDLGPWSVLLYRGTTAKQVFGDVMQGKYSSFGETLYTAELAYTLDQNNLIRRFFKPVFDVVQVAGNITYRDDYTHHDNVKEGNLYLIWRFSRFPWDRYLKNSIAIGDGISYNSHAPFADREPDKTANEFSNVLNYLMLEATFGLPKYPELQLVLRLHHHCTAWGSFPKNPNAGSTSVGLGIRYYFNI